MPNPKSGESKKDFISRCMGFDDMQKYDQKQRLAICHSKFEKGANMESVSKSASSIHRNIKYIKTVMKANEGDTRMIFGKPFEFKSGEWVQSGAGAKTDDVPDKVSPDQADKEPKDFGRMPTAGDQELSEKLTDEQLNTYIETGKLPEGMEDTAVYPEEDESGISKLPAEQSPEELKQTLITSPEFKQYVESQIGRKINDQEEFENIAEGFARNPDQTLLHDILVAPEAGKSIQKSAKRIKNNLSYVNKRL